MKRGLLALLLACVVASGVCAFDTFSRLSAVEPESGKVGDEVAAKGENLDKSKIGEIYLTDGGKDYKAVIVSQTDAEIKFKVPKAAAGRYHLMVLTANKTSMIEQPVVFTIE